ncbi:MAG: molybdopterin-dependent oxidoreductase, partial [Fulvimarina manganoxydans]|uniref:molybdopterin-dependent oxidoreductase n=1 Tax=Fulvimarina manganoxydans TaxID=937218 RepID=UPI002353D3A2
MNMKPTTGTIRTTCAYCGVGCGVLATPQADGSVSIAGDPDHPANFGRLCSKGSALGETIGLEDRLLSPQVDGRSASWDEALERVASGFSKVIAEDGPDAVAFYVSGQFLTEDYYVANKLMKGFIGSGNIDTNSRLCMASSVAGHRRAFGADTVPGTYRDLEEADLVVLVGSNLAWCHPVTYQRLAAAKAARPAMKIVLIDPRRTASAEIADMHLAIEPDGDTALFSGLLYAIAEGGAVHCDFVARLTEGFVDALRASRAFPVAKVAAATGLDEDAIRAFYDLFTAREKVVTVYSQGVNQSVSGTDKVNAIINCHLATGRIGRPGMGPFSITGQPNAMGGREVGGLANQLAAHMAIENPHDRALVGEFWQAPNIARKPGLKAVDLFRAVETGKVKAIWIAGTNPVVSMPDADRVKAALAACPLVVVSDVVSRNDTLPFAHVALPAAAWGEKDGTVTNSERRISRQRPFLPLPGEARPDWAIFAEVGRRMGFSGFDFTNSAEVFDEHARLSAYRNEGSRDFDIGGLAGLASDAYDALNPVQWPVKASENESGEKRFFADGRFYHPDGKARFVAFRAPVRETAANGEFVLNTGRVRDHWHTMTRTGRSARLSAHTAEPFAELH